VIADLLRCRSSVAKELDFDGVFTAQEQRSQFKGARNLEDVVAMPSTTTSQLVRADAISPTALDQAALKQEILFRLTNISAAYPEVFVTLQFMRNLDVQRTREKTLAGGSFEYVGEHDHADAKVTNTVSNVTSDLHRTSAPRAGIYLNFTFAISSFGKAEHSFTARSTQTYPRTSKIAALGARGKAADRLVSHRLHISSRSCE